MFKDLREALSKVFSQVRTIRAMSTLDQVKVNVPSNAQYVTVVDFVVLQSVPEVGAIEDGVSTTSRSLRNPDATSTTSAYMLHDGTNLRFIDQHGSEVFSTPLNSITRLQSMAHGIPGSHNSPDIVGFCCILHDGRSIVLSTPMPVQHNETTRFRTIGRMTDTTGGWAKELEAFGIPMVF